MLINTINIFGSNVYLEFSVNQLTNVTPIEKTKVKGAHTIINF